MRTGFGGGCLVGLVVLAAGVDVVRADSVTLTAIRDTTIFSSGPTTDLSSGEGVFMWCGRTGSRGGNTISRALVRFDFSDIPARSTINSVQLKLRLEGASPTGGTQTSSVHRMEAAWGEGTSNASAGNGIAATAGDASWNFRVYPTSAWTNVGGDFASTPSASQAVVPGTAGPTFSGAGLVQDVQAWVDDAASNFGWMVRGNEAATATARKFATREISVPASRPQLEVNFPPPPPCIADFNGTGGVSVQDIFDFLSAWFAGCTSAGAPPCFASADVNGVGGVSVQDVFDFLAAWFAGC